MLRTTFATDGGRLELTDALAMARGVRSHDLGVDSPHMLLRHAVCTAGEISVEVEFAPRFEYGLTVPLLRETEAGLTARGGATALSVSTGMQLRIRDGRAVGEVRLTAGEAVGFAVQYAPSWDAPPPAVSTADITTRLDDTLEAWRSWSRDHQRYEGPYADLVDHSRRVLQGLTYRPTGAMVAAPTTSLPEVVGGRGTGTTGTRGSGTPVSRWTRCGSPPARTRPAASCGMSRPPPARCPTPGSSRSFSASGVSATSQSASSSGFLPADDPRVVAAIDAVEEHLTDERGLVYRYRGDDGLEGEEGAFLLCTCWLAEALARAGRPVRARAVFERAITPLSDIGLLSEEVDPVTGELIGNFPQAFSHIGLINAVWAIAETETAT